MTNRKNPMDKSDDPRYTECANCDTMVKPAAGYLSGDILCLDCMEKQKDENTI